jgi:hypothetical protein
MDTFVKHISKVNACHINFQSKISRKKYRCAFKTMEEFDKLLVIIAYPRNFCLSPFENFKIFLRFLLHISNIMSLHSWTKERFIPAEVRQ